MNMMVQPARPRSRSRQTLDGAAKHPNSGEFGYDLFGYDNIAFRNAFRRGFTLIELLVVIGVLSLLAAVTLPNLRDIIREQKTSRTASLIQSYINGARAKAIGTGGYYGIVIERSSAESPIGRAHSTRLSQAYIPPPYSGDLPGARAVIQAGGIVRIERNKAAIAVAAAEQNVENMADPIFGPGDFIGIGVQTKYFAINTMGLNGSGDPLIALQGTGPAEVMSQYPVGTRVPFRIVRKPSSSLTAPLELPEGTAIDLVFSGIGLTGDHFSPLAIEQERAPATGYANAPGSYNPAATLPFANGTADFGSITIMFNPSGDVTQVYWARPDGSGGLLVQSAPANSNIYFLLGKAGGVFPDAPFFDQQGDKSNIVDFESAWIVINRQSGEVAVTAISPFAIDTSTGTLQANIQSAIGLSRAEAASYSSVDL